MFAAGAAEDHGHPCTWCRGPDNRPIVAHGFLSPTIPIRHPTGSGCPSEEGARD